MKFLLLVLVICAQGAFAFASVELSLQEILQEPVTFSGPNCHNTSLRTLKLMPFKRYVHDGEMRLILKKYCVEARQTNLASLGVIYLNDKPKPFHSFVPLVGKKVFTKNGISKREPPKVQNLSEMKQVYGKALKTYCRIQNIQPCEMKIKYFQCQKVESELESLEFLLEQMTQKRENFFMDSFQSLLLERALNISFTERCIDKKLTLESIVYSVNTANMASLGLAERLKTEQLEQDLRQILSQVSCL